MLFTLRDENHKKYNCYLNSHQIYNIRNITVIYIYERCIYFQLLYINNNFFIVIVYSDFIDIHNKK